MRYKKPMYIYFIIGMFTLLTACSIPGVTAPMDEDGDITRREQGAAGKKEDGTAVDDSAAFRIDVDNYIPDGKVKHQIGDRIELNEIVEGTKVQKGITLTVNKAEVFENVADTGISRDKFNSQTQVYLELSPFNPKLKFLEEFENTKILMVDLTLKCEDWFIELEKEENISFLDFLYVDNNEYLVMAYPCYLSNSNSSPEDSTYCNFDLEPGDMNIKVGWPIDPEVYNMDKLDLSKVCLAQLGDEEFFEYVSLEKDLNKTIER